MKYTCAQVCRWPVVFCEMLQQLSLGKFARLLKTPVDVSKDGLTEHLPVITWSWLILPCSGRMDCRWPETIPHFYSGLWFFESFKALTGALMICSLWVLAVFFSLAVLFSLLSICMCSTETDLVEWPLQGSRLKRGVAEIAFVAASFPLRKLGGVRKANRDLKCALLSMAD